MRKGGGTGAAAMVLLAVLSGHSTAGDSLPAEGLQGVAPLSGAAAAWPRACAALEAAGAAKLHAAASPLPAVQLRLRGGHRMAGFKRRRASEKVRTSRRIHSMFRPRNARKHAERTSARLEDEERAHAHGREDAAAAAEQPRPVNRNLHRRNMAELLVDIEKFRKAHPQVYEEERNTCIDTQARHFVERWQETLEVPEDEEELDRWERHPEWVKRRGIAHYNLAMCHDTGFVVGLRQTSAEIAFSHYRAAAKLGHVEAMCCTGSCYMYGQGVERDVALATEWYIRAAQEGSDEGSYDAMFNLGLCFRRGVGRPRDPQAALKWFAAAAKWQHPGTVLGLNSQTLNPKHGGC